MTEWRQRSLVLRTLVFTLLVPGSAMVVLPWLMLARTGGTRGPSLGLLGIVGLALIAAGVGTYAWCAWSFAASGRGTPAPFDPPQRLVISGLYRFVRNPIYVGLVTTLLGEALLWRTPVLLVYATVLLVGFHLRVVLYEEPKLRELFGAEFERYCAAVPRWVPRPPRTRGASAAH